MFNDSSLMPPPARLFLVGIGGIGMSGLAQLLRHCGYEVAGSDRGLGDDSKRELYRQLTGLGIRLYAQDGSGPAAEQPSALVLSSAIETDNPDLAAAPGVPVLHRAQVMSAVFERSGLPQLLVAGSCGKTSVTGWIAAALHALGRRILMVDGGYTLDFETRQLPGNFYADAEPEFIVAEIDESDRSIRGFTPDYSLVLNIGDDHYSPEELRQVFADFLRRSRRGAVVPAALRELLPAEGIPARCFEDEAVGYSALPEGISFNAAPGITVHSTQTGRHSAWNGAAVFTLLTMVLPETPPAEIAAAMGAFRGVRQRFEIVSSADAFPVINDYAHNPEKIAAAIQAARERYGSPLGIVFQPHGFGPLGFMRAALRGSLAEALEAGDTFLMLPVYYAGGTSSHSPTSEEVAWEYAAAGLPVSAVPERGAAAEKLRQAAAAGAKAWLVLGARDASLRSWSQELASQAGNNQR